MKSFFALFSLFVATAALQAGNFVVDPAGSLIAAKAKASPPHTFTCIVKRFHCDIEIDPGTLAVSQAVVSFDFANLDSDNKKRDKKMREWMGIDKHPTARFELAEVVQQGGLSIGKGRFSMHGISKEVAVRFSVSRKGDTIILDGETEFSYEDWDLKIIRLLFFTVHPTLSPYFHLEGRLQSN